MSPGSHHCRCHIKCPEPWHSCVAAATHLFLCLCFQISDEPWIPPLLLSHKVPLSVTRVPQCWVLAWYVQRLPRGWGCKGSPVSPLGMVAR
jgi:hypothetical protein